MKKFKLELSMAEVLVIRHVLSCVKDNLQEDGGEYRESYEDWMMQMDAEDYAILEGLVKKV